MQNNLRKLPIIKFLLAKRRRYITLRRRRSLTKHGLTVLSKIKSGFDHENINFWLEFGTLLGVIREDNFLRNDEDLDLGAYFSDAEKIRKFLVSSGFKKKYDFRFKGQIIEERYYYKTLGVDFHYFFREKINNKVFTYLLTQDYPAKDNICHVYKYTYSAYSDTIELKFKDITTNVQTNFEKVLEEKYGPGWRVPTSKWEFDMSPVSKLLTERGIICKF